MCCGNAVPVLKQTLKISYVVVRASHIFLELEPLSLHTVLKDVDSLEDILDASWWVRECLNLLNVSFLDILHGDIQSRLTFSAPFIIITF